MRPAAPLRLRGLACRPNILTPATCMKDERMYHPDALDPIVAFLRGLGFTVVYGEGAHGGFLPGVNIREGVLHVDPETLAGSGDVLHEAGHLAVIPQRFWPRINSDIEVGVNAVIAEEVGPDSPTGRQLAQVISQGEFMAQAWSFAAAHAAGVSPDCIFFPGTYKMTDYDGVHPMLEWLRRGTHYGPQRLAEFGMTGYEGVFALLHNNGLPPFPHMTRWLVE